jgi:NAD(P)-dependent dehydrogenase (short-subunit alcohol dehydrogenase family)
MDLQGKIALVTGGTKGIGGATAIMLAHRGADVAIVGRHEDAEAKDIGQKIRSLGRRAEMILGDCAVATDCKKAVEATLSKLGGLHILVHAAGGPVNGRLMEIREQDWHSAFDVHVHAIFHLSRAAVPHFRQQKEGVILLVGSTAGIRGIITNVAYQAVKGTLPQLTRALARELAEDNIRVNCIAPGVIRTRFHQAMTAEQKQFNLEHRIPLRSEGTPEQVASAICELITNDYITGETLVIDGGLTMRIA